MYDYGHSNVGLPYITREVSTCYHSDFWPPKQMVENSRRKSGRYKKTRFPDVLTWSRLFRQTSSSVSIIVTHDVDEKLSTSSILIFSCWHPGNFALHTAFHFDVNFGGKFDKSNLVDLSVFVDIIFVDNFLLTNLILNLFSIHNARLACLWLHIRLLYYRYSWMIYLVWTHHA